MLRRFVAVPRHPVTRLDKSDFKRTTCCESSQEHGLSLNLTGSETWIIKLRAGRQIVKFRIQEECSPTIISVGNSSLGQSGAMEQHTIRSNIAGLDRSVDQGQFVYRPLNQEPREIRLVQLSSEFQAASDGKLVPLLQMRHAFFDGEQMPQYIALSYTWGTGPKGIVLVKDEERPAREVLVSTNLYDALCHFARLSDPTLDAVGQIFWIDQLCINQNDNDEKSHQVRMMVRPLYRRQRTS